MVSKGVMTKATGHTSTYGYPRDVQVSHFVDLNAHNVYFCMQVAVPKITSKKPQQKTLNQIAELQQLRLEMHQVSPGRFHSF
jgi:hypothetical protein